MLPSTAVGTVEFRSVSNAGCAGRVHPHCQQTPPPAARRASAASTRPPSGSLAVPQQPLSVLHGQAASIAVLQLCCSFFFPCLLMARPAVFGDACVGCCCRSLLEPIRTSNPTAVYVEAACDSLDPDKKVCAVQQQGARHHAAAAVHSAAVHSAGAGRPLAQLCTHRALTQTPCKGAVVRRRVSHAGRVHTHTLPRSRRIVHVPCCVCRWRTAPQLLPLRMAGGRRLRSPTTRSSWQWGSSQQRLVCLVSGVPGHSWGGGVSCAERGVG